MARPLNLLLLWTPLPGDSAEIESRWGRDFSHPSRPALGPWCCLDHPLLLAQEVKEGVKLYLF